MMPILYFVRTLALTFLLLMILQIKVGHRTLESYAYEWVHTSSMVTPAREAATGAARLIKDATFHVYDYVRRNVPTSKKAKRQDEEVNDYDYEYDGQE